MVCITKIYFLGCIVVVFFNVRFSFVVNSPFSKEWNKNRYVSHNISISEKYKVLNTKVVLIKSLRYRKRMTKISNYNLT